ncbi:MAG: type II secretion system F family protein [Nanoarchaeota archaeon]|nr:type II secretion system F family protein [Nanoarchaeota archaeon]
MKNKDNSEEKPEDESVIVSKGGGKIRVKDEKIEWIRSESGRTYSYKEVIPKKLEKETIKRIQQKEKEKLNKKETSKDSEYLKIASKLFSTTSRKVIGNNSFKKMQDQLVKANLKFTPIGYLSTIFLTTSISILIAGFLFLFFLFFNFGATLPIITRATETINIRFFKVFWILFVVPIVTFLMMYIYPSLEKSSAGQNIDNELPFATIHMASIAGSMINPINIFEIINSTKEYPSLEKEFTKMINEINIYGYDIVSALKNTAKNSSSKKLTELLNGLATTLNSGGDLPKFFEERSQTLLFNYRIQQQKDSKSAETSMDMYISLLIAAPMILMLLMMIMKLSGLGISMSVTMIGLLITLGVVILNIFFIVFLQLKRQH